MVENLKGKLKSLINNSMMIYERKYPAAASSQLVIGYVFGCAKLSVCNSKQLQVLAEFFKVGSAWPNKEVIKFLERSRF